MALAKWSGVLDFEMLMSVVPKKISRKICTNSCIHVTSQAGSVCLFMCELSPYSAVSSIMCGVLVKIKPSKQRLKDV